MLMVMRDHFRKKPARFDLGNASAGVFLGNYCGQSIGGVASNCWFPRLRRGVYWDACRIYHHIWTQLLKLNLSTATLRKKACYPKTGQSIRVGTLRVSPKLLGIPCFSHVFPGFVGFSPGFPRFSLVFPGFPGFPWVFPAYPLTLRDHGSAGDPPRRLQQRSECRGLVLRL